MHIYFQCNCKVRDIITIDRVSVSVTLTLPVRFYLFILLCLVSVYNYVEFNYNLKCNMIKDTDLNNSYTCPILVQRLMYLTLTWTPALPNSFGHFFCVGGIPVFCLRDRLLVLVPCAKFWNPIVKIILKLAHDWLVHGCNKE